MGVIIHVFPQQKGIWLGVYDAALDRIWFLFITAGRNLRVLEQQMIHQIGWNSTNFTVKVL